MGDKARTLKFIRDPIHDIIRIQDDFILKLLDTPAVQRLRRIRHLGVAWLVYPGAEHSRFTHSLGVFHLAGRVIEQLNEQAGDDLFGEERRQAVLAAALLHDIGHGPFSHVFERVFPRIGIPTAVGHEEWTKRVVSDDGEVSQILRSHSDSLPETIIQIIDGTYKPHYVTAIVSGQLDVDRFDYLLRDSHMTGARYGAFDLEWMLRTLVVQEVPSASVGNAQGEAVLRTVVVDGERGLSGLEAYLLGRHYMYKHVYYHKTIRAAEQMSGAVLRRAAELVRAGRDDVGNTAFRKMARGDHLSTSDYLGLDDFVLMGWLEDWARSESDRVLRDLSGRLIRRDLLKAVIVPEEHTPSDYADNRDRLRELVKQHQYEPAYYMLEDDVKDMAYRGYLYNVERGKVADEEEIWFVGKDGKPHRLSAHGSVVTKGADALQYREYRWFVPKEVADVARAHLKWG